MSRSYWYTLIVVAAWLALGHQSFAQQQNGPALESQSVAPSRQGDGTIGEQKNSPQEQPKPEILTPALRQIESAIRDAISQKGKVNEQRQEERDNADLQAQQDMAFWAKGMFWATLATIFVTLAGLALIGRTLYHTRRAADYALDMVGEAKAATKAAQDTIEVTREIGQSQVRAYLACVEAKYTITKKSIFCQLVIANKGLSPANQIKIAAYLVPQKPLKGRGICEAEECESISAGSLGDASFAGEFSELGNEVKVSLHDKMQPFAIHCVISWLDVFKKEQEIPLWLYVPLYEISILKPLLNRAFAKREDNFTVRHDELHEPEAAE